MKHKRPSGRPEDPSKAMGDTRDAADQAEVEPESLKSGEKIPESSRSVEKIPESSRSVERIPESSRSGERIPESSRSVEKIPESSRSVEKIPESSMSVEKIAEVVGQNANGRRKRSRPAASNTRRTRSAVATQGSPIASSSSLKDALRICKPVTVTLTRLPESTLQEFLRVSAELSRPKKKKYYGLWKSGNHEVQRQQRLRIRRKKELQAVRKKAAILQALQGGANERDANEAEKTRLDETFNGETSATFESTARAEQSIENSDSPAESKTREKSTENIEESLETRETTAEDPTASAAAESTESESTVTSEARVASQHKPEQINFPKISDQTEIHLATNIQQASPEAAKILGKSASPEQNNNQTRQISLRSLHERNNSVTVQFVETRKRNFSSGEAEEPQRRLSKRPKSSLGIVAPERKEQVAEEKTISVSIKSAVPIAKQIAATKVSLVVESDEEKSTPQGETIGIAAPIVEQIATTDSSLGVEIPEENEESARKIVSESMKIAAPVAPNKDTNCKGKITPNKDTNCKGKITPNKDTNCSPIFTRRRTKSPKKSVLRDFRILRDTPEEKILGASTKNAVPIDEQIAAAESSVSVEGPEENEASEAKTTSVATKSSASVAKKISPTRRAKCGPKFSRQRTKPSETIEIVLREIKILLPRLEDSQEPLTLAWKAKKTSECLKNVTIVACTSSPLRHHLAFDEIPEFDSMVAGVPIASLEDPAATLDAGERLVDGNQENLTNSLGEKDASAFFSLEEPTARPEISAEVEEETDDEEIVQFMRRQRKARPSIDSSSSASSAATREIATSTRVLRSKTPLVSCSTSILRRELEATGRKTPRLRILTRNDSTDSSNSEDCFRKEATKVTPRRSREEQRKTPASRKRGTRETTSVLTVEETKTPLTRGRFSRDLTREIQGLEKNSSGEETSEAALIREEARKFPATRGNIYRDSTEECERKKNASDTKASNVCSSGEETSDGASSPHGNSDREEEEDEEEEAAAPQPNESETQTTNPPLALSAPAANSEACIENSESKISPKSLAEDNRGDLSRILAARSTNREEGLKARRNLTAVKNAMVVLTRLEDLEDLSEDGRLTSGEDFEVPATSTPDPLAINGDVENPPSDRPSSPDFAAVIRRLSPRKTPRENNDDAEVVVVVTESPESEAEINLRLEDSQGSQETTESDVEMTLVFEEIVSQDPTNSDAEDAERTLTGNRSPSPNQQDDEVSNSARSSSSVLCIAEETPTDDASRDANIRENSAADDRQSRPVPTPPHECRVCRIDYQNAAAFEAHKSDKTGSCYPRFPCTTCESGFPTYAAFRKHRTTCGKQPKIAPKKALPKKLRAKNRAQALAENLTCGVCSIVFTTTQALSEHIFGHNTEELQQAYRNAKAKVTEEIRASRITAAKQKESSAAATNIVAAQIATVEAERSTILPRETSSEAADQCWLSNPAADQMATITGICGKDPAARSATVCSCHRDSHPARPDKTDLQIEMVLLCQHCNVIFRRRECFEIHYRASPQCATNRPRGRWPKLYCANCQSTLSSWAGMRRHLEVHASLNLEGTVRFVCNICRVVFVGFGALFYNHWSCHLKDTTYVASRYSFPKNSVQPIGGIPRLPIGAAPGESYILVAEHVCAGCKRPFSTRRDLETHERSCDCVASAAERVENRASWICDACGTSYESRRGLNQHSKVHHGQRFLCVATSPTHQAFMCTRCCAMRKSVTEIELHWKTQPQHDVPLDFDGMRGSRDGSATESADSAGVEISAVSGAAENFPEPTGSPAKRSNRSDNEAPENPAKALNLSNNQVPENSANASRSPAKNLASPRENSNGREKSPVKRAAEIQPGIIDSVFRSPGERQEKNHASLQDSGKSGSTSLNSSMLRNILGGATTTTSRPDEDLGGREEPKATIAEAPCSKNALDGPTLADCLKIVASRSKDRAVDTYKIIMRAKPTPGNMKMILGRTGKSKTDEERAKNDDETAANSSIAIAASTVETGRPPKTPEPENSVIRNPQTTPSNPSNQKKPSKSPQSQTQSNHQPEIIDIAADEEREEPEKTSTFPEKPPKSRTKSISKSTNKTIKPRTKKPPTTKPKSPVKSKSLTDSGASNSDVFPFVLNTAEVSFEEARLRDFARSKQLAMQNSTTTAATTTTTASKKPGFLRVKNLSELQATRTHNCTACGAIFDSSVSLENHHHANLCNPLLGNPIYPKGITAALVLPEMPNATPSQQQQLQQPQQHQLTTGSVVYAAGNVVTQQLIGLDSSLGVISGVPVSSVIVNNDTAGSWFSVGGSQHDPLSSVALVNTTHTLTGGALLMNLGGQPTANGNGNAGAVMATSIATSTQEILAVQQQQQIQQQQQMQQQQQFQQQQLLVASYDPNFRNFGNLTIASRPQIDNSKQCVANGLRATSASSLPLNAPFSQHPDRAKGFCCNICTTYRCNSISAMNAHVMKHYNGFNTPAGQNVVTRAAAPETMQSAPFVGQKEGIAVNAGGNRVDGDAAAGLFAKQAHQGLVFMASLVNGQQSGSSVVQENNNGQSIVFAAPHEMSAGPVVMPGGQIVYRCLICKQAMYKTYLTLRNHVIHVHERTDFMTPGIDNYVQKIYLCTYCIQGAAMYDSEAGLRQHHEACHPKQGGICNT